MTWRIMIVVEDQDYPDDRELHPRDAGWYGYTGRGGDHDPHEFSNYEAALATAEMLTLPTPID